MLGRNDLGGLKIRIEATPATIVRSRYDIQSRTVQMAANSPPSVVAHDMGHWIEAHAPGVRGEAVQFLDHRREAEKLQSLSNFDPTFKGTEENAYFDAFVNPYIGMDYTYPVTGNRYATEIVSMGIQYMYERPVEFSQGDPDMSDFIWGILRGL